MSTKQNEILVIDDEKIVCQSCERILNKEGFSVTTVLSGEKSLNLIYEGRYDAVILDLKIPDISGMEILKVIREKMPDAKVIIITGYYSMESAVEAMKLGAVDYITKPFSPDKLSLSLKEALKRRTVVAGEGDIVKPFIKEEELEEKIKELKYSEWAPVPSKPVYFSEWMGMRIGKDESVRIVLNDLFLKLKGKVEYIDFPQVGDQIEKDTPCFRIFYKDEESFSIKMEEVCAPVSGKVIELNQHTQRKTNIINEDPLFSGWLVRMIPANFNVEFKELKTRKILIADDDKVVCEELVEYFREGIYDVYQTENLQDIIEGAENKRYDLAILGSSVYKTAVYAAAKHIRNADENLPIIVVTEDYSLELAGKVREHNIFFHAIKPLDKKEICLAAKSAFVKIELKKWIIEKSYKFDLIRFIKNIEVVNRSGKHVAIIGMGNVFNEYNSIGPALLKDLKKNNLPVNLDMNSRELLRNEVLPHIERNDKIIIINGMEMGFAPGEVKKFPYHSLPAEQKASIEHTTKSNIRINQIGYPEIVNWINAIGIYPEVVVMGIQTNKCGFGKERFSFSTEQNEKIIDEIMSEVLL